MHEETSRKSRGLPPLNALRAFEAIARHLSFAKAAEELHVTPAALSHQMRGLEDEVGPLFHRRTRAIELTDTGRLIYPGLHAGFESVRGAMAQLDRDRSGNILVISATVGLSAKWLMPRLWRFLRAHPDVDARVSASMKLADFATEGVDVAIRLTKQLQPDLHVEKLFQDSVLPVCSPQLVEQGLRSAADLARFPLIHYDVPTSMHAPPLWADWFAVAGLQGADATRGLKVNVADHALDAAVAGAGVSLSFKLIASDDVHSGRLVTPFGPELPLPSGYHFVCPKGHETRPKVRAFRDWLFAEMEETKQKWAAVRPLA
ncbi:MAG: LysR family transcriptional regulator, glycine cleavage system transcriptional activator [Hyphomicrobiales bacterium]|jgi:LysR family glycine cleavage system transcriptional activator|nr:LysR family transcriptional regulator, glycine cleavage system transcriptional activator [Hyphomicrobiales bacterium]